MSPDRFIECTFFIPIRRDANLSDGELHETDAWEWLDDELYIRFAGGTRSPGYYEGFYRDPDTAGHVDDRSRQFIVALDESLLDELRESLRAACAVFQQKCIYLSVAGHVEFVESREPNTD